MRLQDTKVAGYGTLAVFASIILVSGLFIAWSGPFLYRMARERAIVDSAAAERRIRKDALAIIDTLAQTTLGEPEAMASAVVPKGAYLKDMCGYLNLSWVSAEFLHSTDTRALIGNESVDSFLARRKAAGPGAFLGFAPGTPEGKEGERILSSEAPLNPHIVDETAFAAVMGKISGTPENGNAWLIRLRALRDEGGWLRGQEDAMTFFGSLWPRLRRFATIDAPFNANSVDPALLECILESSLFHVDNPPVRRDAILAARRLRYIDSDELRRLVGLPAESKLWLWLGTTSRFWRLEYRPAKDLSLILIFRTRGKGEEGGCFEILSERIEHG